MRKFKDAAPYSVVEGKECDFKRSFKAAAISVNHLTIVVSDEENRIYGICLAQVKRNFWGVLCASELITFSNMNGWTLRLLRCYRDWAKSSDAEMVSVTNTAGENPRYDKLIERLGFNKIGSVFMMPLERKNG